MQNYIYKRVGVNAATVIVEYIGSYASIKCQGKLTEGYVGKYGIN